jgi:hypothetical protein
MVTEVIFVHQGRGIPTFSTKYIWQKIREKYIREIITHAKFHVAKTALCCSRGKMKRVKEAPGVPETDMSHNISFATHSLRRNGAAGAI